MITRFSLFAVMIMFVISLSACEEKIPAAKPQKEVPAVNNAKNPISDAQGAIQIRSEMDSLLLQRSEAEQERARLELEAQQIQQTLNGVDVNASEIQSKIDQLESKLQ